MSIALSIATAATVCLAVWTFVLRYSLADHRARRSRQDEVHKSLHAENRRLHRAHQDLQESEVFSRAVFEASLTGLLVIDPQSCQIMDANYTAGKILAEDPDALIGAMATDILPEDHGNLRDIPPAEIMDFETHVRDCSGKRIPVIRSVSFIDGDRNELAVFSFLDISRLKAAEDEIRASHRRLETANEELKRHKDQIVQSEKLASIGQLAAGVAHEINNPIGFVTSNLGTLQEYLASLTRILRMYEELDSCGTDQAEARAALIAAIAAAKKEEDLEFIFEDLANVIDESLNGVGRVAEIVQNLKSFAREDSQQASAYDINEGVDSMIKMSWNELKYRCEVVREFGEVPRISCHAGRVNQVVMNMLVNAAQAMPEDGGTITVSTGVEADEAVIRIADTGNGIPPETLPRIFDPFFTTKEVGSGTGLGLSISHGIIEEHGGRIEVASTVGEGTTFSIYLPLSTEPCEELIG